MHQPESILDIETSPIFCNFDTQTDARRPYIVVIFNKNKNRTFWKMDSAAPADQGVEINENELRDKYWDIDREQKIAMEFENFGETSCNWCVRNNPKYLVECQEELEIIGRAERIQKKNMVIIL